MTALLAGTPPVARREEREQELSGIRFADPYGWLEEDSAETLAWQEAQDVVTRAELASWPGREALVAVLRSLDTGDASPPLPCGGRWLHGARRPGDSAPVLLVSETPAGEPRLLVDPAALAGTEGAPATIEWVAPSPSGALVAFGLGSGGGPHRVLHVVEVATGDLLADRVDDVPSGEVAWLPDESGFFYSAGRLAVGDHLRREVRFHRLGGSDVEAREEHDRTGAHSVAAGCPPGWFEAVVAEELDVGDSVYVAPALSGDGRWLVVIADVYRQRPYLVRDLLEDGPWRPLMRHAAGSWQGAVIGDEYVALTTESAPLGRVVAVPLASPEDRGTWRELVPEGAARLQDLHAVGDRLLLTELADAVPRIRVLNLDGREVAQVTAPAGGRIAVAAVDARRGIASIGVEAFEASPSSLAYDVATGALTPLVPPQRHLPGITVTRVTAMSADGTTIPSEVFTLGSLDRARPTLIHGYGGFDQALLPQWAPHWAAFVLAGGAVVIPHLRGGGEYGVAWWEAGRRERKQTTFDDLYAVTEQLVADGIADPDRIALWGGSNGGLLVGAAVTQRPDLWRSAIAVVPVLDLLRGAVLDEITAYATGNEYGDPRDPAQAAAVRAFSPQQNIRPGVAYPAVLVWASANDDLARPWQSRKFVAALHAASTSGHRVRLRVQADAGHGGAGDADAALDAAAGWVGFAMAELGMTPVGLEVAR